MKWLQYRKRYSSGLGNWVYIPLFVNNVTKDVKAEWEEGYLQDIDNQHNWSEHWRGIEFHYIDTRKVPNKHILRAIVYHEHDISDYQGRIETLTNALLKLKKLVGKGRRSDPDDLARQRRENRRHISEATK